MEQEIHPHLSEFRKQPLNCDRQSVLVKPTNTKTSSRKIGSDFFTILIIVYHMVQWIKVNRSQGQSYQDEDY